MSGMRVLERKWKSSIFTVFLPGNGEDFHTMVFLYLILLQKNHSRNSRLFLFIKKHTMYIHAVRYVCTSIYTE